MSSLYLPTLMYTVNSCYLISWFFCSLLVLVTFGCLEIAPTFIYVFIFYFLFATNYFEWNTPWIHLPAIQFHSHCQFRPLQFPQGKCVHNRLRISDSRHSHQYVFIVVDYIPGKIMVSVALLHFCFLSQFSNDTNDVFYVPCYCKSYYCILKLTL